MWDKLMEIAYEEIAVPVALFLINSVWPTLSTIAQTILLLPLILPLWIVNFLEEAINIFSGIDEVAVGNNQTDTILGYFFGSTAITRVFWGITLVALLLCAGFAVIAVVRSMADLEIKRPMGKVLGSVGKAMLTFLIIPFMCFATISLASVVLGTVNNWIKSGGTSAAPVSTSGVLFLVATSESSSPGLDTSKWDYNKSTDSFSLAEKPLAETVTYDELYNAYMYRTVATQKNGVKDGIVRKVDWASIEQIITDFNVFKMATSGNLYIAWFAAWFYVIMLVMVLFIFLRRIYELLLLYIVSPFFVSVIPLDDGQKFKGWRDRFISTVITGFGPLFMTSLFLMLLPLIWSENLVLSNNSFTNLILKVLLMLGGMFATFKSNSLITSIVDTQAAASERETMSFMSGYMISKPLGYLERGLTNALYNKKDKDKNQPGGGLGGGDDQGNKNPSLVPAYATSGGSMPAPEKKALYQKDQNIQATKRHDEKYEAELETDDSETNPFTQAINEETNPFSETNQLNYEADEFFANMGGIADENAAEQESNKFMQDLGALAEDNVIEAEADKFMQDLGLMAEVNAMDQQLEKSGKYLDGLAEESRRGDELDNLIEARRNRIESGGSAGGSSGNKAQISAADGEQWAGDTTYGATAAPVDAPTQSAGSGSAPAPDNASHGTNSNIPEINLEEPNSSNKE